MPRPASRRAGRRAGRCGLRRAVLGLWAAAAPAAGGGSAASPGAAEAAEAQVAATALWRGFDPGKMGVSSSRDGGWVSRVSEALPAANRTARAAPFCCFLAADAGDVCGTCLAASGRGSFCGRSSGGCGSCSEGIAAWCPSEASPAFVLPPPQEAVKRTLQSDGHAPDLAADDDEGPFCCFAATDVANVCATCVARPKRGGFCASSSASCGQCVASSLAAWCLGPSSPAFVLGDPAWAPRNGTPRAPGLADAAALAQKAAAGRSAPAAGPSAAAARRAPGGAAAGRGRDAALEALTGGAVGAELAAC